jgi:hypothetical protein
MVIAEPVPARRVMTLGTIAVAVDLLATFDERKLANAWRDQFIKDVRQKYSITFLRTEPELHHSLLEINFNLNLGSIPKRTKRTAAALLVLLGLVTGAAEYHDAREGAIEFYQDLSHIADQAMNTVIHGSGHVEHVTITPPPEAGILPEEIGPKRRPRA